uniref:WAPL domain-containing protein n=1 Tax=Trichuris muris TaxID=70415 RepID=A0A5S6QWR7_TRIMR
MRKIQVRLLSVAVELDTFYGFFYDMSDARFINHERCSANIMGKQAEEPNGQKDTASDLFDAALKDIHSAKTKDLHLPDSQGSTSDTLSPFSSQGDLTNAVSEVRLTSSSNSPSKVKSSGSMPVIRLSPKRILAGLKQGSPMKKNKGIFDEEGYEEKETISPSLPNTQTDRTVQKSLMPVYVHKWDAECASNDTSMEARKTSIAGYSSCRAKSNGTVVTDFRGLQTRKAVRKSDGCEIKTVSKVTCLRSEKPVYTVVPNVRSAEECQRIGEVQEYNDEAVYFLDSVTVSNSLDVRYLSTCNLLQRCVDSTFRVFLKGHEFIDKIFLALNDSPSHDVLALCCSCLFYIFARDRLSLIVNKSTLSLLIELIKQPAAKETVQYAECKEKIWKTLCEWRAKVESSFSTKERIVFDLTEENISASLMALESLVYISCRNTSQFFMDEIRLSGSLELLGKLMTKEFEFIVSALDEPSSILYLLRFYRVLRVLENVTAEQPKNVGYLISHEELNCLDSILRIFHFCMNRVVDGSKLRSLSSTSDPLAVGEQSVAASKFFSLLLTTFSSLFRLLCNLSNHNDLCCSKLSERSEFIQFCLECVTYTVPRYMSSNECYEFSVLFMSFLVNFIEHHHSGRRIVSKCKVRLWDEDKNPLRPAPEALAYMICKHVTNAQQADNEIDDQIVSNEQMVRTHTGKMRMKAIEQTVQYALVKADKHMEECILASHAGLILGLLIQEDESLADRVKSLMPSGSFIPIVETLVKFFDFYKRINFHDERAERTISTVIETLKFLE